MIYPLKLSQWRPVRIIQYGKIPLEDGENDTVTPNSRSRNIWHVVAWRLLTFLVGLGVGIAISFPLLSNLVPQKRPSQLSPVIPRQVFYPKIPTSWVPDERYIGFSDYSNLMWHRLVRSTESVWVSDPAQYGLGRGFDAQFNHTSKSLLTPQFYHISNLHQLHCLNILRGRYFELQLDLPSLSKQSKTAAQDTAYHVDHCIEYLRMSIMCGGSWDVESNSPPGTPPELKTDPFGHPIGWGGIRNCVNWEALMSWQRMQMEAYKQTWSGIGG